MTDWFKLVGISMILASLTVAPASAAGVAANDLSEEGLPPGCAAALRQAHGLIAANPAMGTVEALARLHAMAGEPCSFNLYTATIGVDVERLNDFIAELNGYAEPASEDVISSPQQAGTCSIVGAGTGTLHSQVLGIPVTDPTAGTAEGDWEPSGEAVAVEGSAGVVSGIQVEDVGTIFLVGIPIPSLEGSTSAECVTIEDKVETIEECRLIFIGVRCKQSVTVSTRIIPCSASATQRALGTDLFTASHEYETGNAACEGLIGEVGLPTDVVIIEQAPSLPVPTQP